MAHGGGGMSAGCTALVQLFVDAGEMDRHIKHCGIISSCQSAATFEIVKALLATSLTVVSSAISSTGLSSLFV